MSTISSRAGYTPMINILSNPRRLIWIGFFCLLIGWTVPMLTVIQVLRPHFGLLLGSYVCALFGLTIGLVGIFTYVPTQRARRERRYRR